MPHAVTATWASLRNALALGFVPDGQVWYPPGTKGAKGDADFDRSFEFFSRTTGLRLREKVRDLVSLPPADAPAAGQVLDSRAGEHATDAGSSGQGNGRAGGQGGRAGGFQFFSRTTGLRLSKKVRDLVSLPPADAPASGQVLDSMAGERATDAGSPGPGNGRAGGRGDGRRT